MHRIRLLAWKEKFQNCHQNVEVLDMKTCFCQAFKMLTSFFLTLIRVACQPTLKEWLVGILKQWMNEWALKVERFCREKPRSPQRNEKSTKGGAEAARFLFSFSTFSRWKRSYFKVLIKLKKNGNTIFDPYQIFEASWCKIILNKSWCLNTNATLIRVQGFF